MIKISFMIQVHRQVQRFEFAFLETERTAMDAQRPACCIRPYLDSWPTQRHSGGSNFVQTGIHDDFKPVVQVVRSDGSASDDVAFLQSFSCMENQGHRPFCAPALACM